MGRFFCGLGGLILALALPGHLAMLAFTNHHLTGNQPIGFGFIALIITLAGVALLERAAKADTKAKK